MRNHGIKSEDEVVLPGTNAKMNEFQAAMGLCNLESVDDKILLRRAIYEHYREKLGHTDIRFQEIRASRCNYIYMPVCFKDAQQRDEVYSELVKNGIKPRKYFFPLTVDFDYFQGEGGKLVKQYGLEGARDIADRVLCLPLYPDLEIPVVDGIVSIIERLTNR